MAYKENGPRPGRNTGRNRNSLRNNASKETAATPLVSPTQSYDLSAQLAQLQSTLGEQLAQLQAKKGTIQGQFKMDRAAVKAGKISGMAETVNDSLERGIIGSSMDVAGRVGVEADAAAGLQGALQAKMTGLLGLKSERIGAVNDYYTGVFDVQAREAAAQAEIANQQFIEDLVMRMNDEQEGANDRDGTARDDARSRDGALNYNGDTAMTAAREGTGVVPTAPGARRRAGDPSLGDFLSQAMASGTNIIDALMQFFQAQAANTPPNSTITGRRFPNGA